jgi:tryptophan-rich sensory protein
MDIQREYEYKPRWRTIALGIALFGFATYDSWNRAETNFRGLTIDWIIKLNPHQATIFYYCLFAVCLIFVLLGILLIIKRLFYRQRIAFTASGILVPKLAWSKEELHIPYASIASLQITRMRSRQIFLTVMYPGGKQRIIASALPSQKAFDEVQALLAARARNRR